MSPEYEWQHALTHKNIYNPEKPVDPPPGGWAPVCKPEGSWHIVSIVQSKGGLYAMVWRRLLVKVEER